jgi:hypothetical protein
LWRYIDESDNDPDLAFCVPKANTEMVPEPIRLHPKKGFVFKVCLNIPTASRMINQCPRIKGIAPGDGSERSCELQREG